MNSMANSITREHRGVSRTLTVISLAMLPLCASAQDLAISQIVTGDGWNTSVLINNFDSAPASFVIRYHVKDENGASVPYPSTLGYTYAQAISVPGNGSMVLGSLDIAGMVQGFAEIELKSGRLPQFTVIYRQGGHEAAALPIRPATELLTSFDTADAVTTLAIANALFGEQVVRLEFFSESGAPLHIGSLRLLGKGHTALNIAAEYPFLVGLRGSLRIVSRGVSALNLRFVGHGFTSVPVRQ